MAGGADGHAGRRRAWIVLRAGDAWVVELDGPTLELMTEGRRPLRPAPRGARSRRAGGRVRLRPVHRQAARRRPDRARSATPCSTSATSPGSGTSGRPRDAGRPPSIPGSRCRRSRTGGAGGDRGGTPADDALGGARARGRSGPGSTAAAGAPARDAGGALPVARGLRPARHPGSPERAGPPSSGW